MTIFEPNILLYRDTRNTVKHKKSVKLLYCYTVTLEDAAKHKKCAKLLHRGAKEGSKLFVEILGEG